MKLLHTADWHLNDRLGRIDRTADLRAAVERVAAYCESQRADVLIVAGDLFSEVARADALRETIRHWQTVFTPFLSRGGTILTLTGNHDNEGFCQTLRSAMTLAAPGTNTPGERLDPGRLYLAAEPQLVRLPDPSGAFDVQFLLMPYPTASRYLRGDGATYANLAEKNQALTKAFGVALHELSTGPGFDPDLPSVLGAHITVQGSTIGPSLFRLSETDDVLVEGTSFAATFDYVALGHIHRPQFIKESHVRYPGSIEHLDLGEAQNSLGIVAFTLSAEGLVGEPEVLPLPSTPIHEVIVLDPSPESLDQLRIDYAGAERDLVKLQIHYTPGEHDLDEILRDLDRIFPRWYARDWTDSTAIDGTMMTGEADRSKSFRDTVLDYLESELVQRPDAERAGVRQLAEDLLSAGE